MAIEDISDSSILCLKALFEALERQHSNCFVIIYDERTMKTTITGSASWHTDENLADCLEVHARNLRKRATKVQALNPKPHLVR